MEGIRDGIDDTQGTSSKTRQDTRRIDEIQGTKSTNRRDSVPIVTCMYPDINRDLERGINPLWCSSTYTYNDLRAPCKPHNKI